MFASLPRAPRARRMLLAPCALEDAPAEPRAPVIGACAPPL